MVEYLEIPLRDILANAGSISSIIALFWNFCNGAFRGKRLNLRGLPSEELPNSLFRVLKKHLLTLTPLIILVYFILSGRTPDFAAVYGIIACVVVGFLQPENRQTSHKIENLYQSLAVGARMMPTTEKNVKIIWQLHD